MRPILTFIALLIGSVAVQAADLDKRTSPFQTKTELQEDTNPFAGLFIGAGVGVQSTDITITDPGSDEYFSGLNADGINWAAHVGFNLCPAGSRICIGPKVTYGMSDAAVHLGEAGDIIEMQDYAQIVAAVSVLAGKSTLIDIHGGYEWQWWEVGFAGDKTDVNANAWVVGLGIKTLVFPQLAVGVNFDYLIFDSIEVDGLTGASNDALSDALEDTDAFRVMVETTWHPATQQSLLSLDNFKF